ncbi:MAG: hypothetical protein HOV81_30455, partial [Kofleriaceae bacterium]|nr:hypothetical protein [Kofleriaceae bacterium]
MSRLAILTLVVAAACTDEGPPVDDIPDATTLPIEVLGAPGVAVAATIDVPRVIAEEREVALELVVSNVVAANAAFVSINGGTPIDLGADASHLRRPSGGTASSAIALPAGAVRAGVNRLVFSYERQVPDVSGFRVIGAAIAAGRERAAVALPE